MENTVFYSTAKLFDIFTTTFTFNLKRESNVSTRFSIPLSLLSAILTVAVIIYQLYEFFTTDKVLVTRREEYIDPTEINQLDMKELYFSFLFARSDGSFDGLLKPKFDGSFMREVKIDAIKAIQTVPTTTSFVSCDKTKSHQKGVSTPVIEDIKQLNYGSQMGRFICLDDTIPFNFGGDFFALGYKHFISGELYIDLCDMFPSTCRTITSLPEVVSMGIMYRNNLPNMFKDQAFESHLRVGAFPLDIFKDYTLKIKLRKNKVFSDDNLLFEFREERLIEFLSIADISLTQMPTKVQEGKSRFYLSVELDDLVSVFNRSYFKLDDTLANIEAMTKVVFLLVQIPVTVLNKGEAEYIAVKQLVEKGIYKGRNTETKIKPLDKVSLKVCNFDREKQRKLMSQWGDQFEEDRDIVKILERIYALENKEEKQSFNVSEGIQSEREKLKTEVNKNILISNFVSK